MSAPAAVDHNAANDTVCIVLMKSPEADATLDYLAADLPHVKREDLGPYWMVSGEGEIVIDLERVGQAVAGHGEHGLVDDDDGELRIANRLAVGILHVDVDGGLAARLELAVTRRRGHAERAVHRLHR